MTPNPDNLKDVAARVFGKERSIVVIDAPTSKMKIFHAYFKELPRLPSEAVYIIPVAHRYDLLSAVVSLAAKTFPQRDAFVVQLKSQHVRQTQRKRPTYVVVIGDAKTTMEPPATVDILTVRASVLEGLRERCCDPNCPLRPRPFADDGAGGDVNAEVNADDFEQVGEAEGELEVREGR